VGRRDNFSPDTKRVVMSRAHFMCSHPKCRAHLLGGSEADDTGYAHVGQCAHIHAAAPGGPRYDEKQTSEERKSATNCIYLCANHATLIDKFEGRDFPASTLRAWKRDHEAYVRKIQGKPLIGLPLDDDVVEIAADHIKVAIQGSKMSHDMRGLLVGAMDSQNSNDFDSARCLLAEARRIADSELDEAENTLAEAQEEQWEVVAAQAALEVRTRNFDTARLLMRNSSFEYRLTSASRRRHLNLYRIALNAVAAQSGAMENARAILEEMKEAGVTPNVVSFNSLLNFVDSEANARAILEEMKEAGVTPDVVSYSALLNFVDSEANARAILEEMKEAGVTPNEITLTAILKNATDTLEDAIGLAQEWLTSGYFVGRGAWGAVFAKPVLHLSAEELLTLYNAQRFKFETALENPINQYRAARRDDDALLLLLAAPYTGASIKYFREDYATTSAYFQAELDAGNDEDNLYYAYGIAAHTNQDWAVMRVHLGVAFQRAYAEKRKNHIRRMMEDAPN